MDISTQSTTQPLSDDQELAKALAGVTSEDIDDVAPPLPNAFSLPPVESLAADPATVNPPVAVPPVAPAPAPVTPIMPTVPSASPELEGIKKTALEELRPLVDKVNLPADERFDIYLMLIRSTDDGTLIAPAHAAAQEISDEKKKAEALLEIIKEIDYLSRKDQ